MQSTLCRCNKATDRTRTTMQKAFRSARKAYQGLSHVDKPHAKAGIRRLYSIKCRIESEAERLGFSKLCRELMHICKGQCCVRQFPKNLAPVDFFVSPHFLTAAEHDELAEKLDTNGVRHQCPLLCPNGCFFSFDARPMVCTTAYPCFVTQAFWEFYQGLNRHALSARQILNRMFFG
ncbi:MAG: hypothetical protein R6U50_08405 [Desulfobacterales bacterium]